MEGRGEERRVVRAHGKKRKGKEPDVTKVYCIMMSPHCSLTVTEKKWLMELITAAYY
jgi:uncharacterized membrane protein